MLYKDHAVWRYLAMAIVGATAACGGVQAAGSPASVKIYKYMGSKQCNGGGQKLAVIKRQLIESGITVLAASCGVDGNLYPAVCGAADGRIGIFEVPASKAQSALPDGFLPLARLPDAQIVPCN
jgi:hypothetical protein